MRDQALPCSGTSGNHRHFSKTLEELAASVATERVELGAISRFMGHRSIGALLLILALPMALPIPLPGISVVFGVPLVVVAAQLVLRRRFAWLPRRLAHRSIARSELVMLITRALPTVRFLERAIRPRLTWLTDDWVLIPVGAVCFILALIIALPIPFGHVVPGLAICVMALGLIERDGIAVGTGLFVAVLALTIVVLGSVGLVTMLRDWIIV
jgi:hypothetical protein